MAEHERLWTPQLTALRHGAQGFIDAPPGNDRVNHLFGKAVLYLTEHDDNIQDLVNEGLEQRVDIPSTHAIGIFCNSFKEGVLYPYQSDRFKLTRDQDPFGHFNTVEDIVEFLQEYLRREWVDGKLVESYGRNLTKQHLMYHNVANTHPNRYGPPMLITSLIQRARPRIFNKNLHIADIGTGDMLEVKHWALRDHFKEGGPQPPIVVEATTNQEGDVGYTIELKASERLQEIWQGIGSIAVGVGADSMATYELEIQRWISSSDYPGRYKGLEPFEKKFLFTNIHTANTEFVVADITKPEDLKKIQEAAKRANATKQYFNVVMAITMMHELTPEERAIALEHMSKLAGPKGIIIIQDFMAIDPHDPSKLVSDVRSFGEPYKYRTYVYADGKLRLWLICDSGRVSRVQIGPEFGMVGDRQVLSPKDQRIFKAGRWLTRETQSQRTSA